METEILKFNDLLHLTDGDIAQTKIHLCLTPLGSNADPIEIFKRDPNEVNVDWFLHRNTKNDLHVGYHAICLVRLPQHQDDWLFTSMKTITHETGRINDVGWEGKEWEQFAPFYGRLIIRFHKRSQNGFRWASTIINSMEVLQLLPDIYEDNHFPGYDNICLSWHEMHRIIVENKLPDWYNALANQKGVYVITDKNTGRLYVGSATGDDKMLLQRWKDYATNGHGNDVALHKIVDEEGIDYVRKNFQYTLLENYNSRVDERIILDRESWWKRALGTRGDHGYNRN